MYKQRSKKSILRRALYDGTGTQGSGTGAEIQEVFAFADKYSIKHNLCDKAKRSIRSEAWYLHRHKTLTEAKLDKFRQDTIDALTTLFDNSGEQDDKSLC